MDIKQLTTSNRCLKKIQWNFTKINNGLTRKNQEDQTWNLELPKVVKQMEEESAFSREESLSLSL